MCDLPRFFATAPNGYFGILAQVKDTQNDVVVYQCSRLADAEQMARDLNTLGWTCRHCGSAKLDRGDGPECSKCAEKEMGE